MPLAKESRPPNPEVLKLLIALKRRGWAQASIAQRIGVGQSAVSQMERGLIQEPNYRVMDKLRELVKSKAKPEAVAA